MEFWVILFSLQMFFTVVPLRLAMADRVSPCRTFTYEALLWAH